MFTIISMRLNRKKKGQSHTSSENETTTKSKSKEKKKHEKISQKSIKTCKNSNPANKYTDQSKRPIERRKRKETRQRRILQRKKKASLLLRKNHNNLIIKYHQNGLTLKFSVCIFFVVLFAGESRNAPASNGLNERHVEWESEEKKKNTHTQNTKRKKTH